MVGSYSHTERPLYLIHYMNKNAWFTYVYKVRIHYMTSLKM